MRFNLLEKNEFPESFEHAWNIYRNIQEMIKLADQKVYVSATVSLVLCTLIGALATINALKPAIITGQQSDNKVFQIESPSLKISTSETNTYNINSPSLQISTSEDKAVQSSDDIKKNDFKKKSSIFLLSGFFLSTGWFVVGSLLSLRARFDSYSEALPNLIFFGDICAKKESSEYITDYLGLTLKDAMEDLLYQIYVVSAIATKKHKYYNLACYGLFSQLLFFILILAGYFFLLFLK